MNNKEFQRRAAYEALILLLILALLLFITRLWPILLLVILGIFIGALRLLFLSSQTVQSDQPLPPLKNLKPSDPDLDSFSLLQTEITDRVLKDYPEARWVWGNRNPRQSLRRNEPLKILLNRAGGYRGAELRLENGRLSELIYQSAPMQEKKSHPSQAEVVYGEPLPENYELIAFEWVDKHLLELNEKLNVAIGLGLAEYRIAPDDLPQPESWSCVCKELQRNGLQNVKIDADGIKVLF